MDEVETAVKTLLSENSILTSRIRSENDWVYFDEYESKEIDIPVMELPCEDNAFINFVVKNYSEELYTARYSSGFLSFFIIVKSGRNISVIGILDHSIADGASVSIIKLKISSILNKKERNYFSFKFKEAYGVSPTQVKGRKQDVHPEKQIRIK